MRKTLEVLALIVGALYLNFPHATSQLYSSAYTGSCRASCARSKDAGGSNCGSHLVQWYFDRNSNDCAKFRYGNCGSRHGNANRFDTRGSCLRECGGCGSGAKECSCVYNPSKRSCDVRGRSPPGYQCACTYVSVFGDAICRGKLVASVRPENQLRSLKDCLDDVIDPTSNATYYNFLNDRQWNQRLKKLYPIGYFIPKTTADVSRAIRCANRVGIRVRPNSGANSYEALGFGDSNYLVIDFRAMTSVQIVNTNLNAADAKPVARVQPGALLGPITDHLIKNGGYGIPMGMCISVGVGGLAIGGGVGYYAGLYGTTLDNVLELTIVDAEGVVHKANEEHNPDLYWAFRGVGPGHFGVVTEYQLKMFQASEIKIAFVLLRYKTIHFDRVMDAYQRWLNWVDVNEPYVYTLMFVRNNEAKLDQDKGIQIHAVHIQDPILQPRGNETFLKALFEIFPEGFYEKRVVPAPYLALILATGYAPIEYNGMAFTNLTTPGAPALGALTKDMTRHRYYKGKSFYVKKEMDPSQISALGRVIQRVPKLNVWFMIWSQGGALRKVPKAQTAFVHRDSIYDFVIQYEGSNKPEDVLVGMAYVEEVWDTVTKLDGGETYQNYPDLDQQDYLQRFYGSNLPRLMNVKSQWDPNDYFRSEMSIPPMHN